MGLWLRSEEREGDLVYQLPRAVTIGDQPALPDALEEPQLPDTIVIQIDANVQLCILCEVCGFVPGVLNRVLTLVDPSRGVYV